MIFLGWALIVVGVGFVLVGFAGVVRSEFPRSNPPGARRFSGSQPSDIIKALADLVKALGAAPQWLAMTIIGMLFIAGGIWLATGHLALS